MIQQTSLDVYLNKHFRELARIQRQQVLDFFRKNPDSTNKECADRLNIPASTISARRNELIEDGFIKDNGKRLCSISHKMAIIWRATM